MVAMRPKISLVFCQTEKQKFPVDVAKKSVTAYCPQEQSHHTSAIQLWNNIVQSKNVEYAVQ